MKNILLVLFSISCFLLSAQNMQPSMMILPYTESEGASALQKYEDDKEYRAIISSIEKAFLDQGASLQDLQRSIQNAREQMMREADKYKDINDAINQNASSEITVLAEITYDISGGKKQFSANLRAVETSTGAILYSGGLFSSPKLPASANFTIVAATLLTATHPTKGVYLQNFMNGMQAGFTKMIKEGRPVSAIVLTDDNSSFVLNQEANEDYELIADKIDEWVSSKAMGGRFRVENSSDNRLEMTVNIMVRDENDNPYSVKKFAKEFRIAILKICAKASNSMGTGDRPDGSSMQENIDKGTIMLTMPSYR